MLTFHFMYAAPRGESYIIPGKEGNQTQTQTECEWPGWKKTPVVLAERSCYVLIFLSKDELVLFPLNEVGD
jgi:hypothetical protein